MEARNKEGKKEDKEKTEVKKEHKTMFAVLILLFARVGLQPPLAAFLIFLFFHCV